MNDDADDDLPEELWDTLDELYALAEEEPEEAYETFQAFPKDVREHPVFQSALAGLEKATGRLEDARARLEGMLASRPDEADLHHQLADLLEDAGDAKAANHHFLETLRLDTAAPREATEEEYDRIEALTAEVIAELPEPFRGKLSAIPVVIEERPSRSVVESGLDPRSLGMFEGPTDSMRAGHDSIADPTRIVLFAENLVREVGLGPDLDDEVRITILHEIGHYFGLDEDDMVRLGLD